MHWTGWIGEKTSFRRIAVSGRDWVLCPETEVRRAFECRRQLVEDLWGPKREMDEHPGSS